MVVIVSIIGTFSRGFRLVSAGTQCTRRAVTWGELPQGKTRTSRLRTMTSVPWVFLVVSVTA
jgi:hypothetical protein